MFAHPAQLSLDSGKIQQRLRAKLSKFEFFALSLAVGILVIFTILHEQGHWYPWDYADYIDTAKGDFLGYYYPYWLLPFFALLAKLPWAVGFILWGLLGITSIFAARRIFGGPTSLVLIGYQMFFILGYGAIIGTIIGGLALLWWGLANKRWNWAGLGFLIAAAKPQTGLVLALVIVLLFEPAWTNRLRVLVLPTVIALLSLVFYPGWPLQLLANLQIAPPDPKGNISLWRYLGAYALLLWLPPILLPMQKTQRLLAIAAALGLAMPYFQQTDLLALFVLPVGWLPVLLGNLGYLFLKYEWGTFSVFWVIPMIVYLLAVLKIKLPG